MKISKYTFFHHHPYSSTNGHKKQQRGSSIMQYFFAEIPAPGSSPGKGPKPPQQTTTENDLSLFERFGSSERPCQVSKTVVQGETSVCEGNLIFNEEFVKTSLRDLSKWNAEIMFPREPVGLSFFLLLSVFFLYFDVNLFNNICYFLQQSKYFYKSMRRRFLIQGDVSRLLCILLCFPRMFVLSLE